MKNPKVSLIVPCYNIEKVCDRFFESLLNQTYNNIEIILVNDGSIDNTEKILLKQKIQLEEKGYPQYLFRRKQPGFRPADRGDAAAGGRGFFDQCDLQVRNDHRAGCGVSVLPPPAGAALRQGGGRPPYICHH